MTLDGKPYPYYIKYSKRARYLRLKLSQEGVITLVIPNAFSLQDGQAFLASKTSWLEKNLQCLPEIKPFEESRPSHLSLKLIAENWLLDYQDTLGESLSLNEASNSTLVLKGCVSDQALVTKMLGGWVREKAKQVLPEQLSKIAELHGFHYNKVTIRGQKTRWGSCSSQKNINLNYKLLFLEPSLVDYVLIHELCHTLEMNHSKRFWSLVEDCDANFKQHDRLLNEVGRSIPI